MPIYYEELLNLVAELCDDRNLRAAVTRSLGGGLIAGASAILGGLLLGPIGLAVGGTVGGIISAGTAKGTFKPVHQILRELPPSKKKELYLRLKQTFKDFGVEDFVTLGSLLLTQKSLQELAIRAKMTIHYTELIKILAELCEEKDLKATARESLKGSVIAGASAFVGGILLGPIGLAVGGLIGGAAAAAASQDFKPVAQILLELPPNKKRELAQRLKIAFKDFNIADIASLGSVLLYHPKLQHLAIKEVTNYLESMSISVISR